MTAALSDLRKQDGNEELSLIPGKKGRLVRGKIGRRKDDRAVVDQKKNIKKGGPMPVTPRKK